MAERTPLVFAPGINSGYYVRYPHYTGSYDRVMYALTQAGLEPHFFQPKWRQSEPRRCAADMADYAAQLARTNLDRRVVVGGFSCGALLATLTTDILEREASDVRPGLLACSLSPWFGLDQVSRTHLNPNTDLAKTTESFKNALSELELPVILSPAQLYVGAQEVPNLQDVHEEALLKWPRAESVQVPTGHNIFADPYLQAISQNAARLA